MITDEEFKMRVAKMRADISDLDVMISSLKGLGDNYRLEETDPPVDGQHFLYTFVDSVDGNPGVLIPAGTTGSVSGVFNVDGDSTFVVTDVVSVQEIVLSQQVGSFSAGDRLWGPTSLSDFGIAYDRNASGVDFGFRITDGGTGRNLDQAVDHSGNSNNARSYIPGRFLGAGSNLYEFIGQNYENPLSMGSILAKNTSVRLDIEILTPSVNDCRIHCSFVGYKVYGD